ncbi:MAG: hypothetical protein ACSLFA_00310 [Mycobacterium sp.]
MTPAAVRVEQEAVALQAEPVVAEVPRVVAPEPAAVQEPAVPVAALRVMAELPVAELVVPVVAQQVERVQAVEVPPVAARFPSVPSSKVGLPAVEWPGRP